MNTNTIQYNYYNWCAERKPENLKSIFLTSLEKIMWDFKELKIKQQIFLKNIKYKVEMKYIKKEEKAMRAVYIFMTILKIFTDKILLKSKTEHSRLTER